MPESSQQRGHICPPPKVVKIQPALGTVAAGAKLTQGRRLKIDCQRRSKSTSTGRSKNASVLAGVGFEFRQEEREGDFPPRRSWNCRR